MLVLTNREYHRPLYQVRVGYYRFNTLHTCYELKWCIVGPFTSSDKAIEALWKFAGVAIKIVEPVSEVI